MSHGTGKEYAAVSPLALKGANVCMAPRKETKVSDITMQSDIKELNRCIAICLGCTSYSANERRVKPGEWTGLDDLRYAK